jgi:hypothetical protein
MNEKSRALYYYLANQEAINKGHLGEFVAIANNQVLGYYKDEMDGWRDMWRRGIDDKAANVSKCFPVGDAAYHVNWYIGGGQ